MRPCVGPLVAALLLGCDGPATPLGEAPPAPPTATEPVAARDTTARASGVTRDVALALGTRLANGFLRRTPDPNAPVPWLPAPLPSHTWSRGVFFEGLVDLARETRDARHLAYAHAWAEGHAWSLDGGPRTRFADAHVAGMAYLDLWDLDGRRDDRRVAAIEESLRAMASGATFDDWTWVDAIHMAMPAFARVAAIREDARLHEATFELYRFTRDRAAGARGLFDAQRGLWYRDATFLPPYAEPNGAPCFWSRGNGWAISGVARALDAMAQGAPHRALYEDDFRAMAHGALRTRRADGFWSVSLEDPGHFGGPEITGTSLFVHALALGVRRGILPREPFERVALDSFAAIAASVRDDDTLAWVQGTGAQPSDRQPVSAETVPNLDDFAVGCVLLASAEVARLARGPAARERSDVAARPAVR